MRKVFAATVAGLTLAFGLVFTSAPASAVDEAAMQSECYTGWYVNPDETDRKPTVTEAGLEFKGNDLIHHATDLALADLTPGSFSANPAPDQPSFFSVEVRDTTTSGYGTLRWNGAASEWDLVTNVGSFSKANPEDFIGTATKWGILTDKTKAISFGVGYTANPPGTVDTVVSSVTFAGTKYDLTCPAKPATEKVSDEKWECATGYSTRGGTVEYAWDAAKHEWAKQAPAWGDWVKQRDLTEEEFAKLECTPPVTEVTLVAPEAIRNCDGLWYTAPEANEKYVAKYEVTSAEAGKFTVKATLKDGYKLKEGTKAEWTLTYTEPTNCPSPSPNPPTDPAPTTGNPGSGGGGPTSDPTPSNASGDLPLTGSSKGSLIAMVSVGLLMFAVGGILLVLVRRRRDADTVESA